MRGDGASRTPTGVTPNGFRDRGRRQSAGVSMVRGRRYEPATTAFDRTRPALPAPRTGFEPVISAVTGRRPLRAGPTGLAWTRPESNRPPPLCESGALPDELRARDGAGGGRVKVTSRNAARAIILDEDDRVLLCRFRAHAVWAAPGGGIEPGEDGLSALRRELREETALVIAVTADRPAHVRHTLHPGRPRLVTPHRLHQRRAHGFVGERRQIRRPEPTNLVMFVGSDVCRCPLPLFDDPGTEAHGFLFAPISSRHKWIAEPVVIRTPSSSCISLASAANSVSPASTCPPGRSHTSGKTRRFGLRWTSRTRPSRTNAAVTISGMGGIVA
jgi:8-oxo-dGTP pyrophosphatase MutT (NUDIX family)